MFLLQPVMTAEWTTSGTTMNAFGHVLMGHTLTHLEDVGFAQEAVNYVRVHLVLTVYLVLLIIF